MGFHGVCYAIHGFWRQVVGVDSVLFDIGWMLDFSKPLSFPFDEFQLYREGIMINLIYATYLSII